MAVPAGPGSPVDPTSLAVAGRSGAAASSTYLNLWVHYDYMVGPGYSDAPNPGAIPMVVRVFKAHGVVLHIDPQHTVAGTLLGAGRFIARP